MKKLLLLLALTIAISPAFSAVIITAPPKKASELLFPIGKTGKYISLLELSKINAKELQELTGKKMKLAEKIGFKLAQKKLKTLINPDETVDTKKLEAIQKQSARIQSKNLRLTLIFLAASIGLSILGYLVLHPLLWVAWIAGLAAAVFFVLWLIEMAA